MKAIHVHNVFCCEFIEIEIIRTYLKYLFLILGWKRFNQFISGVYGWSDNVEHNSLKTVIFEEKEC